LSAEESTQNYFAYVGDSKSGTLFWLFKMPKQVSYVLRSYERSELEKVGQSPLFRNCQTQCECIGFVACCEKRGDSNDGAGAPLGRRVVSRGTYERQRISDRQDESPPLYIKNIQTKEKTASQGNQIWFSLETVLWTLLSLVACQPLPAGRGSHEY